MFVYTILLSTCQDGMLGIYRVLHKHNGGPLVIYNVLEFRQSVQILYCAYHII